LVVGVWGGGRERGERGGGGGGGGGGRSAEHTLMELAWAVVGFEELLKKVRGFQIELRGYEQRESDGASANLISLKSGLLVYLKDFYTKKRTAASHMLVFMIADELRNRNPYAIPVRFIPYDPSPTQN